MRVNWIEIVTTVVNIAAAGWIVGEIAMGFQDLENLVRERVVIGSELLQNGGKQD